MWVKVKNQDLEIDAYLAKPETPGTYSAVIVVQEIFGVNEHIRNITERLAAEGYIAIAPAIYQRQAPEFEVGYGEDDVKLGRQYKVATQADELMSDIQATIDYLYSLPEVKQEGVRTIGFCFGGHVVYLAATLKDVTATASFYGAQIATWCPGKEEPTIFRTQDITGTLYAFFGTEDPLIPNEQTKEIERELQKHNISHQIFRYEGATHGFMCDRRPSYDRAAAKDAWIKVLDLFSQKL
ncbi:dienelactone hydrolase family protein [Waterburya agarophytonicola K14]|uniref:Dienelactone hydrolase family protein n=1 Tax=Waterburya agarophytonicola KI4 TaxID=2874699 RepID=A0A964BNI3_9CYAN|nr:dienelactone hydrolase family protein [Waterburya agarophytonicola]MCC0176688.1 dienelactone hydrolase family protein [Waterburya agarophytonicola KI4]